MPSSSGYNFPEDDRLDKIIKRLEERIEVLERAARVGATSIDSGVLLIKKDNHTIAAFGDLSITNPSLKKPDGTSQMGVLIWRETGELAFSMYDSNPNNGVYQQHFALWDRSGRITHSDDTDSGFGVAAPWVPSGVWLNLDQSKWPATTSGTFVSAWDTFMTFQHPKLKINFWLVADTGTVGEAQVTIDGVAVGTVANGSNVVHDQTITVNTALIMDLSYHQVTIQYRRVSGTGNVKVHPRIAYGRQS